MINFYIVLVLLSTWTHVNRGAAVTSNSPEPDSASRLAAGDKSARDGYSNDNETVDGRMNVPPRFMMPPGGAIRPPPDYGGLPPPPMGGMPPIGGMPPQALPQYGGVPPPIQLQPPAMPDYIGGGASAFGPGGTAFHGGMGGAPGLPPLRVLDTQIECQKTYMDIYFKLSAPFMGYIYPYNNFDKCILFAGKGETEIRLTLSHDMCGAPPPPRKPGWSQLIDPVIEHRLMLQWEPDLVQEYDTSVVVRCDRPEDYNRTIKFNLDSVLDKNIVSKFATHPGPRMWMEIQRGEGPRARPLEGPVFLGETLTLVFTIADPAFWFDSNVLSCWASDGSSEKKAITWVDPTKPAPSRPVMNQITVIENACSVKPKLFGHFQKEKQEFPDQLTLTQWVYFQAFRFPTASRVQIQCDIQVCFSKCYPLPPCMENYNPRSRSRRAAIDVNATLAENKNIHPEQLTLIRALEVLLREEEDSATTRTLASVPIRPLVTGDCITTSVFYGTILGLALFIVLLVGLWGIYAQRVRRVKSQSPK